MGTNSRARSSASQSQSTTGRGVIRLQVKLKIPGEPRPKGLARKRFYLIKGSLADNQSTIDNINTREFISRDCFYRDKGASEELIKWLKDKDCESVYCGEVEEKYVEGPEAVREFQQAVAAGEKESLSPELARKWLTVNLPEQIRYGFYSQRQKTLGALIEEAEKTSKAPVASVMTDRNGTAYFTDLEAASDMTTLSEPLTKEGTTINVASTSNFPMTGFLAIDDEIIKYSSKTETSFGSLKRGDAGTKAASHDREAEIRPPVSYVISNLVPIEVGNSAMLWNCEVYVKPSDLATEKPYFISNYRATKPTDDPKYTTVKCLVVEKPLPACSATARLPEESPSLDARR